jgi:hypothetical protein
MILIPDMRCTAVVASTGARCKMRVPEPGYTMCRYHHPALKPATHALNRQRRAAYYARRRAEKDAAKAA